MKNVVSAIPDRRPRRIEYGNKTVSFIVKSDYFQGPIDLLLHLVRRHEIELTGIGLARLTHEYLQQLELLQEISFESVGEFIEIASLLVEMKTRQVLPRNEFEQENEGADATVALDPRQDLVQRLLCYKKFKDASLLLEERGVKWRKRFARQSDDPPPRKIETHNQPIEGLELWDLVSAFGRILRDNRPVIQESVIVDETPIHVYMLRIHRRLIKTGRVSFTDLFEMQMYKSAMIGIFLAVLELTRHHGVVAEQHDLHSEIVLVPGEGFQSTLDVSNIDDYNPGRLSFSKGDPGSMVE